MTVIRYAPIPVIAALPLVAWWFPPVMAGVSGDTAPLHALMETLYAAGAAAMLCVAWCAPRGEHRLRWTLVACLCLLGVEFDALHLLAYRSMPGFLGLEGPEVASCCGYAARLALPLALLALACVPNSAVLSRRLHWGSLVATLAGGLLSVWLVCGHAAGLPPIGPSADAGSNDAFNVVEHLCALLAAGVALMAVYGDAIGLSHRALEKTRVAAALERERIATVLHSIADGVVVVDHRLAVISINPVAQRLVGLPAGPSRKSHLRAALGFIDTPGAVSIIEEVESCLDDGRPRAASQHVTLHSLEGARHVIEYSISPVHDWKGRIHGAVLVLRDVTDMQQVQLHLQFQASHDALTALPNRRQFHEHIEWAIAQARRNDTLFCVMLIDLDDFKDINDTLGHAVGDELLQTIARRLTQSLCESDTVARIGGDEFAVLVQNLARADDIHPLADRLLHAVSAPLTLDGREATVSCSIGVALSSGDADDAAILLRDADTAMYRAKESGKNNYQYFTADMNAAVQRRVDLGNRLRGALKRSEFCLHYQPQVDLASGSIVGVEALIRWQAEGLGPVSPMDFIPIAEDTGLILPIGTWVLEEACRQAEVWRSVAGIEMTVAVNLSARQFGEDDVAETVARVLDETGLPPRLLELELTESMLMHDAARAADTMARLKSIGVSIALDDFGTGYSSLSYLKRFPLDYVKIDRSFVADIPGDQNDTAIVRSIVALAHSLGLAVIAEGVETMQQLTFLKELGCDEIQGYFVSRPRPAADLLEFLRSHQHPVSRSGNGPARAIEGFSSPCLSTAL